MTQNSKYRTDFELSHQEIDRIVKEVSEILSEFHVERKTCLRARLLIEELLLGIMKSGDRPVTCRFSFIKKLDGLPLGGPDPLAHLTWDLHLVAVRPGPLTCFLCTVAMIKLLTVWDLAIGQCLMH